MSFSHFQIIFLLRQIFLFSCGLFTHLILVKSGNFLTRIRFFRARDRHHEKKASACEGACEGACESACAAASDGGKCDALSEGDKEEDVIESFQLLSEEIFPSGAEFALSVVRSGFSAQLVHY